MVVSSSSVTHTGGSQNDPFLYLFAIILPPLAVAIRQGSTNAEVSTNILLTLLGWIPGVLNAWYLIGRPPAQVHSSSRNSRTEPVLFASKDKTHRRSGSGSVRKDVYIDGGRRGSGRRHQPDMQYVPVPVRARSRSRSRRREYVDAGQPQIVLKRARQ